MHLTDEQFDVLDEAIDEAMWDHESLDNDSRCSCGVVNNMDGDVLHGHRVGVVSEAVRSAILSLPVVR